ncbi:MAG: hypothetical protein CL677_08225 [Bdellovibrionaceae bacterium]|nr:hypothetical protein [Pseudobdellovibrionaceae bacterium]|tara:strand:+ start:55973 stop:56740 length:768 start_codon:yes stop_codon:yes gene_type:complete
MKARFKILYWFGLVVSLFCSQSILASEVRCKYGQPSSCPEGQFCINSNKDLAVCRSQTKSPKFIDFPFGPNIPVWCDQGNLTPAGNSHTWVNTAFALDLHSKRSQPSEATVHAVFSGKVIAYSECNSVNDKCGLGFGNQVKILNTDGRMAFYAHLKNVFVKTGNSVNLGDPIGTEGMTGWTGKNNPHLHLSIHENWRTHGFDYWKQTGYLPPSIPFKLKYCKNGCSDKCVKVAIDSREIPCRRRSKEIQAMCRAK